MTCPVCARGNCQIEQLREGYRLCGTMHFYFKTDQAGRVIEWGPTNKSDPKRIYNDARPVIVYAKKRG